jgi:hypothetical protein
MPETINFLISMALTFFAFSVMVSGVVEVWSAMRGTRGTFLWRGVRRMIGSGPTADAIAGSLRAHASIRALSQNDRATSMPSYIPASVFASALCDVLLQHGDSRGLEEYGPAEAIASLPQDLLLKPILQTAWRRARGDMVQFELELGKFFDMSMDRVSGWYKRDSQARSVIVGLVMAVALNINSVTIAGALWSNPDLARSTANQAPALMAQHVPQEALRPGATPPVATLVANRMPAQLPVGWPALWAKPVPAQAVLWHWSGVVLGFIIMAASCLVGAPLWYQLLTMLMPFRSSGPVPACGRSPAHHEYDTVVGPPAPRIAPGPTVQASAPYSNGAGNPYEAQLLEAGALPAMQHRLHVAQTGVYDLATRTAIREQQLRRGFAVTGQLTRLLAELIGEDDGVPNELKLASVPVDSAPP